MGKPSRLGEDYYMPDDLHDAQPTLKASAGLHAQQWLMLAVAVCRYQSAQSMTRV